MIVFVSDGFKILCLENEFIILFYNFENSIELKNKFIILRDKKKQKENK